MWHDDIAVVGVPTAVEHRPEVVVLDRDHHTPRGLHLDVEVGHRGELARPGTGRVDDVVGFDGVLDRPADLHAGHVPVLNEYVFDGRVWVYRCAVVAGVCGVRGDEPRRIDDGVGNLERALDIRCEVRDSLAGRVGVKCLYRDADLLTGRPLGLEIIGVVPGELDEQPPGVADAGPGDFLEYPVFGEHSSAPTRSASA